MAFAMSVPLADPWLLARQGRTNTTVQEGESAGDVVDASLPLPAPLQRM